MRERFSKEDTLVVKGVAIIWMLLHHCYTAGTDVASYGVSYAPFSSGTVIKLAVFGKVCVGIFVFLSAYGITISLEKLYKNQQLDPNHISCSIVRRIWKIFSGFFPVYIISVIGCAIWAPNSFSVYKSGLTRVLYVFLDMLGVADLFNTPMLMATWWYLSLALIQILLMPALFCFYKRFGAVLTLGLGFFLPTALQLDMSELVRWLPAMVLGLWFADQDILVKIRNFKIPHLNGTATLIVELIVGLAALYLSIYIKNSAFGSNHLNLVDSLTPLVVIVFTDLFLNRIPGLRTILMILGQYSMNIFLFHNFIRARWFEAFSYSFHYWWLIVLVLVADNLLISIVIEWFKKRTGYQKFTAWVEEKILIL